MNRICLLNKLIKCVVLHISDVVSCTHLQQICLEITNTSTDTCSMRGSTTSQLPLQTHLNLQQSCWKWPEKASFTHSFLCFAVIKQPSHVAVPETLIRSVWIIFCVTVLVVVPVRADPLCRITLRQTASVTLGPIRTSFLRMHILWLADNNNSPSSNCHCRKKRNLPAIQCYNLLKNNHLPVTNTPNSIGKHKLRIIKVTNPIQLQLSSRRSHSYTRR